MLVDERRRPAHELDVVPREQVADDVDLLLDDVLRAPEQVADGDVVLEPVALSVHVALRVARQVQNGLAHRLRRDRPRVDADAADHVPALDDRDPLAELRSLNGSPLPGRDGADHDEVERVRCDA